MIFRGKLAWCAVCILLVCVSCGNSPRVGDVMFGSTLNPVGETSGELVYTFTRAPKTGTAADLFNYLYFEGDTVCFSAPCGMPLQGKKVAAYFVRGDGKRFRAERLEMYKETVFGFSLVGSLMEEFFIADKTFPVKEKNYSGKNIPFECVIEIDGAKPVVIKKSSSFKIMY